MVNVAHKDPTSRVATASGRITIPKIAYELVTGVPEQRDGDDLHANADAETASIRKARAKAQAKGDVLTVAQLAAIMGCKRTADLIPLCHPLQLSHIAVTLHPEVENAYMPASAPRPDPDAPTDTSRSDTGLRDGARLVRAYSIVCRATVSCEGKTGVEMEALTAVSVGLLTVWDMLKAVAGREMAIGEIMVTSKEGGAGGSFVRTRA